MADGSVTIDTKLDTDGLKSGLGKIGSIAKGVLKGVTVAIGAVTTAFAGMVTASVKARGEMEQVVGGAKKIFDEMDYSKIEKDANEAYRTMNLSAKEYLDMMNSVGATFASSMGDEKGYDTAKKGLQAIADYASGTGADINNLNEKYKMITRSTTSYLSIADQFSGILPQTTDGFLKQAQASGFLSKEYQKLNDVPVAEYQQAISQMLEKGVADMGLLGNTLAETETTLTGSLNALKASWSNFLSGSGDLSQVVDSAEIAFENILRIASEAVPSIITNITKSLPKLIELGRKFLDNIITGIIDNLPMLMESAGQILNGLSQAIITYLPQLIPIAIQVIQTFLSALYSYMPQIYQVGMQMVSQLIVGIAQMLPTLIPQWLNTVLSIAETILDNIDLIIDAGIQLILGLADGLIQALPRLIEKIPVIIEKLVTAILNNLPKIIEAGIQLILKLIDGLIQALPKLIEAIPKIIDALITAITENLPKIIEAGIEMTIKLAEGLIDALPKLIEQIPVLIEKLVSAIINNLPKIIEAGFTIVVKLAEGLVRAIPRLVSKVPEIIGALFNALWNGISGVAEIGANIVQGIWNGIANAWDWLVGKVRDFASSILSNVMGALGIHSPSRLFRDKVGKNIALGIGEGFEDNIAKVYRDMKSAVDFETQRLSANLSTSANYSKVLTANINVNGLVEMDGNRVGRLVAPAVSRTLRTAGA